MTHINGVELREPETQSDKLWYSYIKSFVDEVDFGSLEIKMTIKAGKVTMLKVNKETSFSIHNQR